MKTLRALALAASLFTSMPAAAQEVVRTDHFVTAKSIAPGLQGGETRLYVREVAPAKGKPKGVVLFIHGAGTPLSAGFDLQYGDYSWMAYLAKAGFDAFAVDLTGYGQSTRPSPMADPCNIPQNRHKDFPKQIGGDCEPSFLDPITIMGSDWKDIEAVVDHVRGLRHVKKIALIGWSQGGARTGGYAIAHPDQISRLVVLAPSYRRDGPLTEPKPLPFHEAPMAILTEADLRRSWERQRGCPDQIDPATEDAVVAEQLASDPEGGTWSPPVRRSPSTPTWGFNKEAVAGLKAPYLMIRGANDKSVDAQQVQALYEDLGSKEKVYAELACSSHNAMWERNHLTLFKASLDWLSTGKVQGVSNGKLQLGQ